MYLWGGVPVGAACMALSIKGNMSKTLILKGKIPVVGCGANGWVHFSISTSNQTERFWLLVKNTHAPLDEMDSPLLTYMWPMLYPKQGGCGWSIIQCKEIFFPFPYHAQPLCEANLNLCQWNCWCKSEQTGIMLDWPAVLGSVPSLLDFIHAGSCPLPAPKYPHSVLNLSFHPVLWPPLALTNASALDVDLAFVGWCRLSACSAS